MKKKDRNSFGGKLNSILWEQEMSMTDLADQIGVAPTTVFHWVKENRPPRLDLFALMCDTLQISGAEVFELVNTYRKGK